MRAMLSLLSGFALLGAAHATTNNVQVFVDWRVTIDPQGHITTMTALPHERVDKVPAIRTRLEQEVRKWQFLPGRIDGRPAETNTGLYLRVTLIPNDNNTARIRVDYAAVGPTEASMTKPRYPADAVRHRKTGQVILAVAYDTDGQITSVEPAKDTPRVDPTLTEASEEAVRKWHFQPEIVGGHPLAGRALVPICYSLYILPSGRKEGHCDWKPPGSKDALRDGESFALTPAAKLLTDVAGRTL